jgi:hypothetical protein
LVAPGSVLPQLEPGIGVVEGLAVAVGFYLVQLLMVAFMASIIRQMGDVVEIKPSYGEAYTLAAVAPTPLWLAPLALFVPSVWFCGIVMVLAWVASAALIYHGAPRLFRLEDHSKSNLMGSFILTAGVVAWFALLGAMALGMSMIIGLR